jgi:hypothetical protein
VYVSEFAVTATTLSFPMESEQTFKRKEESTPPEKATATLGKRLMMVFNKFNLSLTPESPFFHLYINYNFLIKIDDKKFS